MEIGDRVRRVEDIAVTGATVLSVEDMGDPWGLVIFIAYDEGGDGWWPASALEAE
jgi:hypothetical protein